MFFLTIIPVAQEEAKTRYVTLQAKTEYDFRPVNDSVDRVCVKCKLQYHCKLFLHAPTGPMVNLRNVSEHFKAKNWKKMSHNIRI